MGVDYDNNEFHEHDDTAEIALVFVVLLMIVIANIRWG